MMAEKNVLFKRYAGVWWNCAFLPPIFQFCAIGFGVHIAEMTGRLRRNCGSRKVASRRINLTHINFISDVRFSYGLFLEVVRGLNKFLAIDCAKIIHLARPSFWLHIMHRNRAPVRPRRCAIRIDLRRLLFTISSIVNIERMVQNSAYKSQSSIGIIRHIHFRRKLKGQLETHRSSASIFSKNTHNSFGSASSPRGIRKDLFGLRYESISICYILPIITASILHRHRLGLRNIRVRKCRFAP